MRTQSPYRRRFTVRLTLAVAVLGLATALAALPSLALPAPALLALDRVSPETDRVPESISEARPAPGVLARDVARIPPSAKSAEIERTVVSPCARSAEACVQLSTAHFWLTRDGEVVRDGFVSSGGEGQETPTGTFAVQWKDRDHISGESGVPMPYSVFFTSRGHALHEGSLGTESAGCVRLDRDDAAALFAGLEPGDELQILP